MCQLRSITTNIRLSGQVEPAGLSVLQIKELRLGRGSDNREREGESGRRQRSWTPSQTRGDAEELSIQSTVSLNVSDRDLCDEQHVIPIQSIHPQKSSNLVK